MKLSEKISKGEIGFATYMVAGTIILLLIIFGVYALFAVKDPEPDYQTDPVSGEKYTTQNTGAPDGGVTILGLSILRDNNYPSDAYIGASKTITNFFNYGYPKLKRVSYIDKSLEQDLDRYKIRMRADDEQEFNIEVGGFDGTNYYVKIYQGEDLLLDYDAAKEPLPTKSTALLYKELPYTFRLNNGTQGQFKAIRKDDGSYEYYIYVNTCGDETLQQEARSNVYSFLQRNNFVPSEVDIKFPNTCDGEAH